MAYDVYWTGYDFVMDIEALETLGISKESSNTTCKISLGEGGGQSINNSLQTLGKYMGVLSTYMSRYLHLTSL